MDAAYQLDTALGLCPLGQLMRGITHILTIARLNPNS